MLMLPPRSKMVSPHTRGSIPPVQVDDAAVDGVDREQRGGAFERHSRLAGIGGLARAVEVFATMSSGEFKN